MNMSKKEKLLAAKKKLKEFQMNKMMNKNASKQQNHSLKSEVSQSQRTKDVTPEEIEINQNSNAGVPVFNHESMTNNKSTGIMEDNSITEKTNILVTNDVELSKENAEHNAAPNEGDKFLRNEEPTRTIGPEDCPMGQKEYLLEMASQVADVLTNNTETAQPPVESDLVYRNQFVNSYLEEQKKLVNDLHIEMNTYRSRVLELEKELAMKDGEFQARLAREVNPLKDQLQAHAQTTGILIAEKTELTAALAQTQQIARQNAEEVEEVSGNLRNAQNRIIELEKEVVALKTNNEETRMSSVQLHNDYENLERSFFDLRKEKEELTLEASELKQKLNLKKTELMNTQQELQEKTALLSLSELKIQQMKDAAPTEEEGQDHLALEQELNRTKALLAASNEEKEAASKQYQNYIRQLDTRQSKLLSETQSQSKLIEDLQAREQSYVQRLSELEQQLQQEREKNESFQGVQNHKEAMDNLLKNIDELTLEQERLHIALAEKDTQIENLTKEVRDLQDANNQTVEVSKLATALESEQLGASRAVSQNQQLKQQLTEMENAFVSLSNTKLDLTEQLQAERSIGKKLNMMLNKIEAEADELKEKLEEKESALMALEKERLQTAQIADQMQHYQAQSQHVRTFQLELQNALAHIERLEKEKRDLLRKLSEKKQSERQESKPNIELPHQNGTIDIQKREEDEDEEDDDDDDDDDEEEEEEEQLPTDTEECHTLCDSITDPIKRLEERFKQTMERVAELTEEKQKLEHLVMQLQSETETIGEYITLYQRQRAVLQTRAQERENAFRQLLDQRNQQQEQLHKMKVLVSNLLSKQVVTGNGPVNPNAEANDKETVEKVSEVESDTAIVDEKEVSELLDLLTEIKDCKDPCICEPNFHPCPWCSGKLITV